MTRKGTRDVYLYRLLNKPYGVLCQFTDAQNRPNLSAYGPFPKSVYPAGRLDADSEGLVLLTNDGAMKHRLLDPSFRHPRLYWVQVERIPGNGALDRLRHGVIVDGKKTLPALVNRFEGEPGVWDRPVPIRMRKQVPTCWLEIIITEGRNRQVRKMTAAIGHPTLRLIRAGIANLRLGGLMPGEHRDVSAGELRMLRRAISHDVGNRYI